MNANKVRQTLTWLVMVSLALGLVACGGSEDKPVAGYPDPEGEEAAPGEVVTVEAAPPTEEPAKGDEEGLETLGGGFEWRREGGIAGFCDVVTVYAGTATVATCRTDPPEILADVTLTNDQSQMMLTWLEELAPFEHEQSDGEGVADSMSVVLTFEGQGDNEPTDDVITAMEALALELLQSAPTQ